MDTPDEIDLTEEDDIPEVSWKSCLKNGVFFGHATRYWNPKMAPVLYGKKTASIYRTRKLRNKKTGKLEEQRIEYIYPTYIFDLNFTIAAWEKAKKSIKDIVQGGGKFLIIGNDSKILEIISHYCEECNVNYVAGQWKGGTLTNFNTIRKTIDNLIEKERFLELVDTEGSEIYIGKKEKLKILKAIQKLNKMFGGIKNMKQLPDAIFVTSVKQSKVAIKEANKLGIPVFGICDSDSDPTLVDFCIPANDDSTGSLKLFLVNTLRSITEARKDSEQYVLDKSEIIQALEEQGDLTVEINATDVPVEKRTRRRR